MKSTGIIRRVDPIGRITIPKEMRDDEGMEEKAPIEIFKEGHDIIIRKYEESCCFCNETKNIVKFKEKTVCLKCINNIMKLSLQNNK